MPRAGGSERPQQRQSPRAQLHLKSSACAEANSLPRAGMNRSSKLENRPSSRSVLHEKKKVARLADLEPKLCEMIEELKKLKMQLASAEADKGDVEKKLEKSEKLVSSVQDPYAVEEVLPLPIEQDGESCLTMDTSEVSAICNGSQQAEKENKETESLAEARTKLVDMENELDCVVAEKEKLEKEAEAAKASASAAIMQTEEMEAKLAGAEEELKQSRALVERLQVKLEAEEAAKASLEAEMKRLRIQNDQWRKASEAAAAILAADDESRSNEKQHGRSYDHGGNGLTAEAELREVLAGQKRGGGGIRLFTDIWKKKGQQE